LGTRALGPITDVWKNLLTANNLAEPAYPRSQALVASPTTMATILTLYTLRPVCQAALKLRTAERTTLRRIAPNTAWTVRISCADISLARIRTSPGMSDRAAAKAASRSAGASDRGPRGQISLRLCRRTGIGFGGSRARSASPINHLSSLDCGRTLSGFITSSLIRSTIPCAQHLADRFDRGMQPLQLIGFELQELMGSPNIADD